MTRIPPELNPQILRDHLPDDYRDVLNQAERNVNRAVGELIGEYKNSLLSLSNQLEEGKFPEELRERISEAQKTLTTSLDEAGNIAEDIRNKASQAQAESKKADAGTLGELAQKLSSQATELEERLKRVRDKAKEVGELSGKAAGSALRRLVIGGL